MPLKIAMIAAEAAPLAKTGGLGDVTSALASALRAAGHSVLLFMPGYARIDRAGCEPVPGLDDLEITLGTHRYRCRILRRNLPETLTPVHLVDCPALYARQGIYCQDGDEHLRFLALTRAALEACRRAGYAPDIVHVHDWHAAFAPLWLKTLYRADPVLGRARSVLSIHNIGHQGSFSAAAVDVLGLGAQRRLLHQDDLAAGWINPLKHGVLYADAITTVSPSYAREIQTPEYGIGLDGLLRMRRDALTGILNGVDYRLWDPRHDPFLPIHYSRSNLRGKARLRQAFAVEHGLNLGLDTPLAGIVSRLSLQKGFELLYETLPPRLARGELALAVLGSGASEYQRFFAGLAQRFPDRVLFHAGYSEVLAHWIEAASDMFLMPSRYEPCGLNQLYSLRYGTVPVVRRTGGLGDSVQPYDPTTGRGTGIVFEHFDAAAMDWALGTALALYANRGHWRRMQANGMAMDFSWGRQAARYVEVYHRLLGLPEARGSTGGRA